MNFFLLSLVILATPVLQAGTVLIVGVNYEKVSQTLEIVTLVKKSMTQELQLKWGICQQTYPMNCFAFLSVKEDVSSASEENYLMETFTVDVSTLAKPTYVTVRGDNKTRKQIFIDLPAS
ncbi:MAG: hypothetical protein O2897_04105 [bacterium]|nr:hypothetical protein [bacterium]